MAYIYNQETGEFEDIPDDKPTSGSSGSDSDSGNNRNWLKIAGCIALTILGAIFVATTGETRSSND